MPIFIICCLLLAFLVKSQSVYLPFLIGQPVWLAGVSLSVIFLSAAWFKKLSSVVWHDGFACGVLWAWYADWQPLFDSEAPMFFVFPIYYALLSAWMTLAIINKSAHFDVESRNALRYLQNNLARFDTRLLGVFVLITLMLPDHYLLYPVAMTLFIVRYTLQRCLEIVDCR
ncbi:hypothetical protein [Methylomonas sp. MgM2]